MPNSPSRWTHWLFCLPRVDHRSSGVALTARSMWRSAFVFISLEFWWEKILCRTGVLTFGTEPIACIPQNRQSYRGHSTVRRLLDSGTEDPSRCESNHRTLPSFEQVDASDSRGGSRPASVCQYLNGASVHALHPRIPDEFSDPPRHHDVPVCYAPIDPHNLLSRIF